jgi:DUF2075 family protein
MGTEIRPIVYEISDNAKGLRKFYEDLIETSPKKEQSIILHYPIVYIHNWENADEYEVYIGESNNIIQRTKQHYDLQVDASKWQHQLVKNDASLYIIGHEHFNKSLTLDIENRLMHYMMSADRVKMIHNLRENPQKRYYPDGELDDIFRMIWGKLRKYNKKLFPKEETIKDSALFKASPLHKLTEDQEKIKSIIIQRVFEALDTGKENQIIFIEGEAGTGKTVLNSSAFYDIYAKVEGEGAEPIKCYMMVNHDEQFSVYSQIAQKLGLVERYGEVVSKPTSFINRHSKENPVDVAFVDEAHLLLTQGKQAYRGNNQLQDIVDRARVTVVMFDENQILTTEQYWESQILNTFREKAKKANNYYELMNQLRIRASKEVVDWIDAFTKYQHIPKLPSNLGGYDIQMFEHPEELEQALKDKASNEKYRLSRIVATYDWEYNNKASREGRLSKYWEVMIEKWHKPWNRELEQEFSRKEKHAIKSLSWAEQPHTIDEVGSTFTIQGFDLNYVGVILGPSVKYRNGKVIFDPEAKNYKKMTQNRTLSDGTKKKFGEELIQHEVRVLMTRGIEGLYIYACDQKLREELLLASGRR